MALETTIKDGETGRNAKVTSDYALLTALVPSPAQPPGTPSLQTLFTQYCTDTGIGTGSNAMNINGSVTNQVFYIKADITKDIYIRQITVYFSDFKMLFKKFGDITALTNGVKISIVQNGLETDIVTAGKTTGDMVILLGGDYVIIDNVDASGNDAVLIRYTAPIPLRLGNGTTDILKFTIRDDLTGLVEFNAVCLGYKQGK